LVLGARAVLENLRQRNVPLYIASGTTAVCPSRGAVAAHRRYFGKHIYGALDDYQKFSKKNGHRTHPAGKQYPRRTTARVGDGYVENSKHQEVAGWAVAVASDEANTGLAKWTNGNATASAASAPTW